MAQIGEHAVVIGASIAGLLAARALTDFYEQVTVVERDVLPEGPEGRKAVPQGHHAHALLPQGRRASTRCYLVSAPRWPPPGRPHAPRWKRCGS